MLLAIETSCDETALALYDAGVPFTDPAFSSKTQVLDGSNLRWDLVSSQVALHRDYGGVVPEVAAREHVKNLPRLFQSMLFELRIDVEAISALAVTRGPGLKGSLLVGISFAKSLAWSRGIPLLPIHHMEGHILAPELLPPAERPEYPALALVVSGGHTLLVYVEKIGSYKLIATTRDDAAGEAFDKAATLLGLPYPGGPSLSKRATEGDPQKFKFPAGMVKDPTSFSFSGLKTAIARTVQSFGDAVKNDPQLINDLSASVEFTIAQILVLKTLQACEALKPKTVILTGGVAANGRLRQMLKTEVEKAGIKFSVPPPKWCTDNAAMIGIVACREIERAPEKFSAWSPNVDDLLGPDARFDIGALPRWPVGQEMAVG